MRTARHFATLPAILLLLHAPAQSLDWAHQVGSTQADVSLAVTTGAAASVITVGYFALTADLDPGAGTFTVTSNGSSDVFIQALDSAGGFLWGGSFGAGGADQAMGVAADAAGNVYVTGRVSGTVDIDPTAGTDVRVTANTSFDVFVVKLSPAGDYLWGRLLGGNGNDFGYDVAVDGDGNCIIGGVLGFTSDIDPGPGVVNAGGNGQQDAFVLKLNAAGDFVWGFAVGGTANDLAYGVAVDGADNVFVCGEFRNTVDFDPSAGVLSRTSGGSDDAFLLKTNSSGAVQWAFGFGSTGSERAQAVAVGPDGAPVLTGRFTSTVDFDPGAGSFLLAGDFSEPAFVAKLNSDGTFAWAFMLKSFLNEGMDVAVDSLNNAYVCGSFGNITNNPLDLDPGTGVTPISANGGGDAFLASYGPSGGFLWGFGLGSAQNDIAHAVALGTRGRIQLAGVFLQTLDADPGPNTALLVPLGFSDGFTIQYTKPDCAGVFVRLKAILGAVHTPADFLAMSDPLRTAGLIPLEEPYTAMGFTLEQPAATTPLVLSWTLSSAIVDWVLVELRDPVDPTQVLARRAALLQRDGDVVEVDGVAPVGFCLLPGDYHVALRHRNHLGVMTAAPVALGNTPLTIDLTLPATPVFGTDARRDVNGTQVLWPNNTRFDNTVKYTGAANDRDAILVRIGGIIPTATVAGYWPEDANMDGVVKYTGAANDRDPILTTIGPPLPTGTRTEQLP
ncbi:MAG TPA: hypothetical protein PKE21_01480 [Flavobacteriales bacterium]|nr:hypothetical protein [Flavobacteriales bacterium]HMR26124.1 hypothetical protein [Flavobacteriales bacterium]